MVSAEIGSSHAGPGNESNRSPQCRQCCLQNSHPFSESVTRTCKESSFPDTPKGHTGKRRQTFAVTDLDRGCVVAVSAGKSPPTFLYCPFLMLRCRVAPLQIDVCERTARFDQPGCFLLLLKQRSLSSRVLRLHRSLPSQDFLQELAALLPIQNKLLLRLRAHQVRFRSQSCSSAVSVNRSSIQRWKLRSVSV